MLYTVLLEVQRGDGEVRSIAADLHLGGSLPGGLFADTTKDLAQALHHHLVIEGWMYEDGLHKVKPGRMLGLPKEYSSEDIIRAIEKNK